MPDETPKGPPHVHQQFDQAKHGPDVKPPETLESLQAERRQLEDQLKRRNAPHRTYEMDGSIGEEVRAGVDEANLARYSATMQKIAKMQRERKPEQRDAAEETVGPEKDKDGDQDEEPELV